MIYLAQPFSHENADVRARRMWAAAAMCALLFRRGITVYSPIVHWYHVAKWHNLPNEAAPWANENRNMLLKADMLLVLPLTGWHESHGLKAELEFWREIHQYNCRICFVFEDNITEEAATHFRGFTFGKVQEIINGEDHTKLNLEPGTVIQAIG